MRAKGLAGQKRDRQPRVRLPDRTGFHFGASELLRVRPSISDHGNGPEKGVKVCGILNGRRHFPIFKVNSAAQFF
jgi:hypothetical protein